MLFILGKHGKMQNGSSRRLPRPFGTCPATEGTGHTMWHSWHKQISTVYAAKRTISCGVLLLLWVYSYPCFSAVNSSITTDTQSKQRKNKLIATATRISSVAEVFSLVKRKYREINFVRMALRTRQTYLYLTGLRRVLWPNCSDMVYK